MSIITIFDEMQDVWRPIPGFEDYEINRNGEVWSAKSNQHMKTDNGRGKQVYLSINGKPFTRSVPKLVDLTFPEYKKVSAKEETVLVVSYISEHLGIDLELWQRNKLQKWLTDHKVRKAENAQVT